MANGEALGTLGHDQKTWSATATALKDSIGRARWIVLGLAVLGAILETWGAQIHVTDPKQSLASGYGGAAALAIAAVVRQWLLGHDRIQAWIVARSASEAFKREIYLFRTKTGSYTSDQREQDLLKRREQILAKLQTVQRYRVNPKIQQQSLGWLNADEYLAERIQGPPTDGGRPTGQVPWYIQRAEEYSRTLSYLNVTEFGLAILGALLGAGLTITGKQGYGAWVAVITTITAAIAAHALAQRYDQIVVSYRATADRLTGIVLVWRARKSSNVAELVEACEAVLLEENQGWIAGADQAPEVPPPPRTNTQN